MSRRKVGTSSVSVSVALRMENAARLARMMSTGRNRSEIVDNAVSQYFHKIDARNNGGLGSFAKGLDTEERFKMMRILVASMRPEGADGANSSVGNSLDMLIDTMTLMIDTLHNEMSK